MKKVILMASALVLATSMSLSAQEPVKKEHKEKEGEKKEHKEVEKKEHKEGTEKKEHKEGGEKKEKPAAKPQ